MTQDQWMVVVAKIAVIADAVTLIAFIAQYTAYAKWWRNAVGRTIVYKDILLAQFFSLFILSLFFHLSRLTSRLIAWYQISLLIETAAVVVWRIVAWRRLHKAGLIPRDDGNKET